VNAISRRQSPPFTIAAWLRASVAVTMMEIGIVRMAPQARGAGEMPERRRTYG
jgi:uncharacterized membrane protein YidH (DUF202 family)